MEQKKLWKSADIYDKIFVIYKTSLFRRIEQNNLFHIYGIVSAVSSCLR